MNSISRRRFLAGVSAATLPMRVNCTEARIPASAGSSPTAGGLAQVNLNGLYQNFDDDYATINILMIFSEWHGDGRGDPLAMLNSDGYPTGFATDGFQWQSLGTIYYPGIYSTFTATLSGTNTMTVTSAVYGSGLAIGQTVRGTGIPNGTRISSGSGTVWKLSNNITPGSGISCIADIPWVFDGRTGTDAFISLADNGQGVTFTRINITADREEYHIEPYAGCTITGSTSRNVLTATAVTGTVVQRTYGTQLQGPGIPPFTMLLDHGGGGGTGAYFLSDMLGSLKTLSYTTSGTYTLAATPANAPFPCTALIRTITATPSNMRLYRQDEEALLNAGQTVSPAFKNYYGKYGRIRFLNWQAPAVSPLSQWLQRPLESNFSFGGVQTVPAIYAGVATQSISASGTNDYSCSASVSCMDSSGNIISNPSSWQDHMMVQMQFPGSTPPAQIAVTAISHANPCQITAPGHGLLTGASVQFSLDGGSDNSGHLSSGLNTAGNAWQNPVYTITVIDANNFTLNGVNSTSWGTYSGSGITVYQQIRFKCGALPYKPVVGPLIKGVVGTTGLSNYVKGNSAGSNQFNLVYNASMDVLVAYSGHGFGAPIETMCKIANDCGFNPWIHTMFAADNNFVTQQATVIKNTLNSNLKWCVEYSNENWNSASQFGFEWSMFNFAAQFPGVTNDMTLGLYNWFGMRFGQMMSLIETVYGASLSSRVTRILSYKEGDFLSYGINPTGLKPYLDGISFAALTSPATSPISHADNYCYASYWGSSHVDFQSQTQADQAIVTYQQGFIAGNQTTMNNALTIADTNFQNNVNDTINNFGQAATFNAAKTYMGTTGFSPAMCAYEGGLSQDALTLGSSGGSYLGTPYNGTDHVNFWIAYQASSLWAASWKLQIQAWKAVGGIYYSQFQGSQFEPSEGSMWAMTYQNVLGPTLPGKAMYDQYNAGLF